MLLLTKVINIEREETLRDSSYTFISVLRIRNAPVYSNHSEGDCEIKFKQKAVVLVARWVSIGNPECWCLNSNTFLHTYIYMYTYIFIYFVRVIQYLQYQPLWFDTFYNIYFGQFQLVNVDYFSLDCLSEVIALHSFGWLVDNFTDLSRNESISDIKVSCSNV